MAPRIWRTSPVYPRARGRDVEQETDYVNHVGVPPRTGKTCLRKYPRHQFHWCTPADGEDTPSTERRRGLWAVYPRARGRHYSTATIPQLSIGVPPRTGKTPLARHYAGQGRRCTPAHGEDTAGARWRRGLTSVYPRARGRHYARTVELIDKSGVPPRTGKTQAASLGNRAPKRCTPAHGEDTSVSIASTKPPTVYPRARGRHVPRPNWIRVFIGVLPRTGKTLFLQSIDASAHFPAETLHQLIHAATLIRVGSNRKYPRP